MPRSAARTSTLAITYAAVQNSVWYLNKQVGKSLSLFVKRELCKNWMEQADSTDIYDTKTHAVLYEIK